MLVMVYPVYMLVMVYPICIFVFQTESYYSLLFLPHAESGDQNLWRLVRG